MNIPFNLAEQILHTLYDMVVFSEQKFIFMTQFYNIIPVLSAPDLVIYLIDDDSSEDSSTCFLFNEIFD